MGSSGNEVEIGPIAGFTADEAEGFFALSPDPCCIGIDGCIVRVNRAWEEVLGWPVAALLREGWTDFVHPDDLERTRALGPSLKASGRVVGFVNRYRHRNGSYRWLCWSVSAVGTKIFAIARDVTWQERAREDLRLRTSLREIVERRAHLLDSVDAAVIATDLDGLITEWNEAATKLYGFASDEVVGRRISEVTVGVFDRARAREITKEVMSNGSWEGEFEVQRRDGSSFPAHVRNTLIRSAEGSPVGIVGVSADMSDRRNRERRASGEREYLRAITESMGEGLFALDSEGRLTFLNQAGEQLLGWREHELQGQVMHDLTHYRQPDGSPLPRESCGILPSRRDGETVRVRDDFFVRKDGSMLPVAYTAAPFETDQGVRGSVIVFSDITEQKRRQQQLQATIDSLAGVERIRQALDRDGLLVYAQPIVELAGRQTVLHELLVRMRDVGDDRVINPSEFLPIAEDDGIIVEIDRWMLGRAVELAAAGHEVSVNVSGRSMFGTAAIEALRAALERTGADASRIVIELTETALVSDTKAAFAFVSATKELGCRIALDDFGTGYGGFSYLKRLPVDVLKIDMEFVQDLTSSSSSQSVVQAVVSLAGSFGYKTIAEGVEDEATAKALTEFGVDFAQGYLFARPAPVGDVLAVDAPRAAP